MFKFGNKMPEKITPVLFGRNIGTIQKPRNKNLCNGNKKGRAAKSCKPTCNKSIGGKTSTNTDRTTSSQNEGPDLSDAEVIWRKLAKCE